jgi:hypothetical protein
MGTNQLARLLPRPPADLSQYQQGNNAPVLASAFSPREVKEVDKNFQTTVAIEEGTAYITGLGQAIIGGFYRHSIHCQEQVFGYAFSRAEAQTNEFARHYLTEAAHQASINANEDIGDATRLGAALVRQAMSRPIEPAKKGRGR